MDVCHVSRQIRFYPSPGMRQCLRRHFSATHDRRLEMPNVADRIVEALEAANVNRIYGLVGDSLNGITESLRVRGKIEWIPVGGVRPIEVIAKNTKPTVMLQLDVGTCLEAGSDPVAWIRANPGRIRSLHCKDWSPDPTKGYTVLFGEGAADWKAIFKAAENGGGVEYYLIEQEGSRLSELDTARKCLDAFKAMKSEVGN